MATTTTTDSTTAAAAVAPRRIPRDLLLKIHKEVFEVSAFVRNHPGEGIHDVYLNNFTHKDVTDEFERYHFTDQPEEWMLSAREKGFDPENGIAYVGEIASFFGSKIPRKCNVSE
jgi:cytochrome b involved in lipid metabolism